LKDFDAHIQRCFERAGGGHRILRSFDRYDPRFLSMNLDGAEKRWLNFSSNDYLALSREKTGHTSLESQPSSRLLGGGTSSHAELEAALAQHWGLESALLYPTGYMANLGVLSCLPTEGDLVLMDRYVHASLIDGVRLSKARFKRYAHLDLDQLERELQRHRARDESRGVVWVVTESLFSMDGDLPDVERLAQLKERYSFFLVVDEAHGIGVYGVGGRGYFDQEGHLDLVDVLTFNLSKSFALQGGVVMGSKSLIDYLVAHSRSQIYTTATPFSNLAFAKGRLESLAEAGEKRERLQVLHGHALDVLSLPERSFSPIVPIPVGDGDRALALFQHLWTEGVYCPAILPPTVPKGGARLRLSLNAAHELGDLETLAKAMDSI
jgi:8-amino-7-oxononanoate synthase